jgi:dihydrofolate reductase
VGKVILYIAASLDGFIAGPDGDISWLEKYQAGTEDYGYTEFYKNIGACIMGSKTYEKALTLIGGIDNNMPTFVVSRRNLVVPAGADVTFYHEDLPGLVGKAKAKSRKDVWLVGGGELAKSFFKLGLIDDIILSTIPIILGSGIPLFGLVEQEIQCKLVRSDAFESGIVQNYYTVS